MDRFIQKTNVAEKEQALVTLTDRKANLGERLSKIKWQEYQLRLEKDNFTLKNDQLIWEEDLLFTSLIRYELKSSVLEPFSEARASVSAGNRA